ncbi:hypothetical protein ANN_18426 [Periplaneta americana]|uniref:Uncharacterized protein n=1 Tax=Periplaneta americana TaxID=6978 RepID=A0ABQ8SNQ4_PERAM|nr:hypothetical protein ANN_18426 [Periplaneta americana]
MAGLCEDGNEPTGSLKAICKYSVSQMMEIGTEKRFSGPGKWISAPDAKRSLRNPRDGFNLRRFSTVSGLYPAIYSVAAERVVVALGRLACRVGVNSNQRQLDLWPLHTVNHSILKFEKIISSHLISSHLISSHLISSHLISSHLISSHLISSHLISSHLISSHLISSHLISSRCSVDQPPTTHPRQRLRRSQAKPSTRNSYLLAWPPNSPDLTPPDFFVWGFVKDIVYS